ncbi:MAG: cupin domain-containing protein [Acidobacteriia bacterium]|nr:cupin domain-containing protein [Terriglobia bacterium]
MTDINQLMRHLRLEPLPVEGGCFRQTWVSDNLVSIPGYASPRPAGTAIYYLLTSDPDSFSAMHRLASDEIYHFYLGDPVEMLLLDEEGGAQRIVLGPDLLGAQHVQYIVSRYIWQGSRVIPGGRFALLGTTMVPGFDPRDFTLGRRDQLVRQFPGQADLICELTRG